MIETIINFLSWCMLLAGGLVGIVGGLGVLRFPDIYTRMHAAGMTDTLCTLLIIGGMMLQAGLSKLTLKLIVIMLFMRITSSTCCHALARPAWLNGVETVMGDEKGEESSNSAKMQT